MSRLNLSVTAGSITLAFMTMSPTGSQAAPYPSMAPRAQYLIADRTSEIALARSAAPPSISEPAGVMVLGDHGFETVESSKNGFVCIVERAWDKPFEDAEFWNPRMRAPICLNAAAVSTVLPIYLERAQWAMSGLTNAEMKTRAEVSAKANTTPGAGAMSYMLSKDQYLSDTDGRWRPHVMFFTARVDPSAWGANVKGSPVLGASDSSPMSLFFIPVRKWSDGTLAEYDPAPTSTDHHQH